MIIKIRKNFSCNKNISFELHAGEVISFVGPNGAGKTTLIKSISNYLVPTSGQVEVEGVDLIKYPRKLGRRWVLFLVVIVDFITALLREKI